ncbi:energy-coupling factor transporter transmembrane protein EcfT [Gemella sp. zg-1178]|uniref:energy-coupling factor transporter transmembrane component T family protein n=1 Tax=Gemella sp. zg-1178 TaxID=2840372 RepID=UPI001C040FE9|nr:energy-coupling factor transporter transmembrane component T [Gemella sp. zg-1178]MBU0278020.1 energy-coupling factor transporter transmembrane protein EcfT [Gemella sp. zg-1178]
MSNYFTNKYIPMNTIIHNLDPRVKLFFSIVYLINIFLASSIIEFSILFFILLLVKYYSKIKFVYLLASFKLVLILIIFTSLIHLVFNSQGNILISILGFNIYTGAVISIILISVRFFLVVAWMVIFTITCSSNEITHGIEKSLNFLNKVGLPISSFALLISICLRFIPTISEETNRIINAQVSRGANINAKGMINKIKNFIPILVPIFVATLKRADELATAMEVRGYDPNKKRSKYKQLKYKKYDILAYIIIFLITITIYII